MWNLFFMVPTAQAETADLPSPEEFESAFARIYELSQALPFKIKTSEAPHYRRYVLQQRSQLTAEEKPAHARLEMSPINEGKGLMFISHTGQVQPGGFLPVSAGNVRDDSVLEIYRNSEVLRQLRDPNNLRGKCGRCEFREICGGSRARAYALSGDIFAEDPSCVYIPRAREKTTSDLQHN
jgi:radical SAM protein with 4Fe4S-binding SPASM domain